MTDRVTRAAGTEAPKGSYVYVVFRPNGIPCYVGKGTGGRWLAHIRKSHNERLLRIAAKAGGELPVVKVREGLTDEEACALEVALIAAIGRADLGRGPLVNLTDGGEGTLGLARSNENRAKVSLGVKAYLADPVNKEKRRQIMIASWATPERRAKQIAATTLQMASPEARAAIADMNRARQITEETRGKLRRANVGKRPAAATLEKLKAASTRLWTDPAYRSKVTAALSGRVSSETTRAKQSAAAKARWARDKSLRVSA